MSILLILSKEEKWKRGQIEASHGQIHAWESTCFILPNSHDGGCVLCSRKPRWVRGWPCGWRMAEPGLTLCLPDYFLVPLWLLIPCGIFLK